MTHHTITPYEKKLIREAAMRECGVGLRVEAYISCDLDSGETIGFNRLTKPDGCLVLEETVDLKEEISFDLVEGGRAKVVFYIYRGGRFIDHQFARWENGVLSSIDAMTRGYLELRIDNRKRRHQDRKQRKAEILAKKKAEAESDPEALPRPVGFADTGRRDNCAVVAFATLAGISYMQAEDVLWESIKARGYRKIRSRWCGAVWPYTNFPDAAKALGIKLKFERFRESQKDVVDVVRDLNPDKTYIIVTKHHAMSTRAGLIMDQSHVCRPEFSNYGHRKVESIWEVEK